MSNFLSDMFCFTYNNCLNPSYFFLPFGFTPFSLELKVYLTYNYRIPYHSRCSVLSLSCNFFWDVFSDSQNIFCVLLACHHACSDDSVSNIYGKYFLSGTHYMVRLHFVNKETVFFIVNLTE